MQQKELNDGLLEFIANSPTPFHAVSNMLEKLEAEGFKILSESDEWIITAPGKYVVTRNDSSIIAFTLQKDVVEHGFNMAGAHTDSPCLKIKPNPDIYKHKYLQVGVETYGGVLLHTWFDRDLSIAGRISYTDEQNNIKSCLVDFRKAVAFVPSLAIHLDIKANEEHTVNRQTHLPPLLMRVNDDKKSFQDVLSEQLKSEGLQDEVIDILDFELSLYDTQSPTIVGVNDDFIASARLDNLLSCYVGLCGLLDAENEGNALLVCNDHEEIGSASTSGAQGTFLRSVLERLTEKPENFSRMIDHSLMISADNAHGVHPNFSDKHDENHGPILNEGPVIKINTNQRYATNSESSSSFKKICRDQQIPFQSFVVRSDMACGSTIGPITASKLGVRTVDVGVPTFGMHSIRELAGADDAYHLYRALRSHFA